ncbi:MAG: zinc ribbon domain-containing protein [Candidatus Thermoplasmatota archaeon]|nr:zinc ribbon domain-containing protein [Candidatus Thermoplasmatota archaeon]MBU1940879.1 zinc ribbon domain-containing protein [Candidatus Thermoplasmatota archaeon]
MTYCTKCGGKLPTDADFCPTCGISAKKNQAEHDKVDKTKKETLEESMENIAENIGKSVERVGKHLEQGLNDAGNRFDSWYDTTFKIGGPLVGSFLALIILRLVIYGFESAGETIAFFGALSLGLYTYLLYIFAVFLLSGYNNYFHRKYKKQYQWMYPFVSAAGSILSIWIAARIFIIIDTYPGIKSTLLASLANFIDTYLILIFIAAILIAYSFQLAYGQYQTQQKK